MCRIGRFLVLFEDGVEGHTGFRERIIGQDAFVGKVVERVGVENACDDAAKIVNLIFAFALLLFER